MGTWSALIEKRWNEQTFISSQLSGITGEFSVTILFGKSGEGKTSTLRALAGLDRPDSGEIRFENDVWFSSTINKAPQQRGIGLLLQDRALFPHMTVAENVAYGIRESSRDARDRTLRATMEAWGISHLAQQYPRQLSGGEQQLTALARSLAPQPRLLLLDEPFSSLDEPARERLGSELRRHLEQYAIPVVLVTHRRSEALALGDNIVVMDQGRTVQTGCIADVFNRPATREIAAILGWKLFPAAPVLSRTSDQLTLQFHSRQIIADASSSAETVRWAIRPDDVMLIPAGVSPGPLHNALSTRIRSFRPDERGVRIELDDFPGFPVIVPRSTSNIEVGSPVQLTFPINAVRVYPA